MLWQNAGLVFRRAVGRMKTFFTVVFLVLLAIALPFFFSLGKPPAAGDPERDLPWQIQVDAAGDSHVFGLVPGKSTLADARRRFGDDLEVALIAAPGEVGSIEAYYAQVPLGFVLGRLILTLDLPPEDVAAMRERALKAEHMESLTKKITLAPADRARLEETPVRAIGVIPNLDLDEASVLQRFGPPAERLATSATLTHLLYPDKGLDIALDARGKDLLQYVAPRDFARLREPLRAAAQ